MDRMTNADYMRERISTKGIQARDIKVLDLLTDDDIAGISSDRVYEWVRTGRWRKRDFDRWLKAMKVIE